MSFTERAGLFPVLLLTGCASPVVVTGPPSGSVVDGYLTRSAADISAMQYRLHQSGPSAQRPVSPSSVKTLAPLLSRPTLFSALPVRPPAVSLPLSTSGAGPADGFVRQSGAAPTLRSALRKIVPPGHTLVFDKTVFPDAPELWQWTGNDRWPYVTDKLLATRGLKATVNVKTNTVTIEPLQLGQTAHASGIQISPPVPASAPGKSASTVPVKSGRVVVSGRDPFRGDVKGASPALAMQSTAGQAHGSAVPIIPPPAIQIRYWRIESGLTVRDWLYSQAAAETCNVPGIKNWTVAWLTPTNYRVDAPLMFKGSFRDMLNQLFTLYGTAKVPLYAGVGTGQCVVKVDDKAVQ